MSRKNLVQQQIKQADGSVKTINHKKPGKGGDYSGFWKEHNMTPKWNSKRQQRLRKEAAEKSETISTDTVIKMGGE